MQSDHMNLYIFNSTKDPNVLGFTVDQSGSNLPPDIGPWTASHGSVMPAGVKGVAYEPILAAIKRDGFYIARSATILRDAGVPWGAKS